MVCHLCLGVMSQPCIYFRCSFGYQEFLQEVSVKRRPIVMQEGGLTALICQAAASCSSSPTFSAGLSSTLYLNLLRFETLVKQAVFTQAYLVLKPQSLRRLCCIVGRRAWLSPAIPLCSPCVTQMTKSVTADSPKVWRIYVKGLIIFRNIFPFAFFQTKHRRKHKHAARARLRLDAVSVHVTVSQSRPLFHHTSSGGNLSSVSGE